MNSNHLAQRSKEFSCSLLRILITTLNPGINYAYHQQVEYRRQPRNAIKPCTARLPGARHDCDLHEEKDLWINVLISLKENFIHQTTISCKNIIFYEELSLEATIHVAQTYGATSWHFFCPISCLWSLPRKLAVSEQITRRRELYQVERVSAQAIPSKPWKRWL